MLKTINYQIKKFIKNKLITRRTILSNSFKIICEKITLNDNSNLIIKYYQIKNNKFNAIKSEGESLLYLNKKFPNLFEVYGKGLIAAMIFDNKIKKIEDKLKLVVEESMKKGLLLCYTGRESIKIGPPLTITREAIKEGLDVIEGSLKKIFSHG